ncbi:MAG: Helix-turn-helix domain [Actinomycetota bacterium]|jgi:predicted DNA-binding transcriptional regulator AlpA
MQTNICTCNDLNRLLTVNEVAVLLGVKPHTLHTWRSLGKETPLAIRIGGLLRYRVSDVLEWVDAQVEEGGL